MAFDRPIPATEIAGTSAAEAAATIASDHYDKALVGTDLKYLLGTDMFEATAEGNWLTTESVRVWVVGYDGMVFGSGWHHDESGG